MKYINYHQRKAVPTPLLKTSKYRYYQINTYNFIKKFINYKTYVCVIVLTQCNV
jgi:hypothetical protein